MKQKRFVTVPSLFINGISERDEWARRDILRDKDQELSKIDELYQPTHQKNLAMSEQDKAKKIIPNLLKVKWPKREYLLSISTSS